MTRSLVVGASGAVGRFLLPKLAAAGHAVYALSRAEARPAAPPLRWLQGDLGGAMPALPEVDLIFSLGPLDAFATWFERCETLRPQRLVALGSMSVETKRGSIDVGERELAARLLAAEEKLIAHARVRAVRWTLLRSTLIYGAGVDRSLSPILRFARRWRLFPRIPAAAGLRQPVHAEDLAAAALVVSGSPATFDRCYALGGGERLPFSAMLERLRGALPIRTLPLPLPLSLLQPLGTAAGLLGLPPPGEGVLARLRQDLVVEQAAAIADFDWAPRVFDPRAAVLACWPSPNGPAVARLPH